MRAHRAFTLIELVMAVAIIAILAVAAMPNLMEARTRSKVAAAREDLRTLTIALECYRIEHLAFPPASGVGAAAMVPFASPVSARLIPVTTPVAYVTEVPWDTFPPSKSLGSGITAPYDTYDYLDALADPLIGPGLTSGGTWRLASPGPDLVQASGGRTAADPGINEAGVDYDPTNGTVSTGDLVAVGSPDLRTLEATNMANPLRPGILRSPEYRYQW